MKTASPPKIRSFLKIDIISKLSSLSIIMKNLKEINLKSFWVSAFNYNKKFRIIQIKVISGLRSLKGEPSIFFKNYFLEKIP